MVGGATVVGATVVGDVAVVGVTVVVDGGTVVELGPFVVLEVDEPGADDPGPVGRVTEVEVVDDFGTDVVVGLGRVVVPYVAR